MSESKAVEFIELESITTEGTWRRAPLDPIKFLATRENISKFGLRSEIDVYKKDDGVCGIISGHTRFLAFLENRKQVIEGEEYDGTRANIDSDAYKNWTVIPAKIVEPKDTLTSLELTLSENAIRGDMNPMDESDLLTAMKVEYERQFPETKRGKAKKKRGPEKPRNVLTFVEYIAQLTGRHRNSIYNTLHLQDRPSEEQENIRAGRMRKSVAAKKTKKLEQGKNSPGEQGAHQADAKNETDCDKAGDNETGDDSERRGDGELGGKDDADNSMPPEMPEMMDDKDIDYFIGQVKAFGFALKSLDLDAMAGSAPEIRNHVADMLKKVKTRIDETLAAIG